MTARQGRHLWRGYPRFLCLAQKRCPYLCADCADFASRVALVVVLVGLAAAVLGYLVFRA